MPNGWPASDEVHAVVGDRVARLFDAHGGLVAEYGRRVMSQGTNVLSAQPHSPRTVLVPGACIAAGGNWRTAVWPAVAAECVMAAADLFDDVADADPGSDPADAGVLLTAAAGLLALSGVAVARVVEDGVEPATAVALAQVLGAEFVSAANGQAESLRADRPTDAVRAYDQAAAKSGPLGSLMARLGARTATDDPTVVDLLGEFGRRMAVQHQLLNDARDAAPETGGVKADVRAGARTVPLVFSSSGGAPPGLSDTGLAGWENQERARVAAAGGLAAALALAEAERLHALEALRALESRGHSVDGLRALLG